MFRHSTRAIRLTHIETGISVTVDDYAIGNVGWHKMLLVAKRILACRVWAHRNGVKYDEFDRVRTYHTSPYGTWTKDHRTGERTHGVFLGMTITEESA